LSNATCDEGFCYVKGKGIFAANGSQVTTLPATFTSDCASEFYTWASSSLSYMSRVITDGGSGLPVKSVVTSVSSYAFNATSTTFGSYSTASNGLVSSFSPTLGATYATTVYSTYTNTIFDYPSWFSKTFDCCVIANYVASVAYPAYESAYFTYDLLTSSLSSSYESKYHVTPLTTSGLYTTKVVNYTVTSILGEYQGSDGLHVDGIT